MRSKLNPPKSLATLAYEAIRNNIIGGIHKPGEWLRQDTLSRDLGVSVTPIRQALERLIAEGITERVPNRGVRVIQMSEDQIAEVYAIRLLLEPIIVRLATVYITDRELSELDALVNEAEEMVSLDEMAGRRQMNRQFHIQICEKCQNKTLSHLYDMVWNRFPDWALYEGYFQREDSAQMKLDSEASEHRSLLKAIASRDGAHAEQLSYDMITGSLKDEIVENYEIDASALEEKHVLLWPRSRPSFV